MTKSVVFSGSQPSGIPTIANYVGAFRQWKKLQDKFDCIYCIVDMHALTVPSNTKHLTTQTLDTLAWYIACGIDPQKSTIFVQSHVLEHSQLHWFLGCLVRVNELNRMVQFKKNQTKNHSNLGLLSYPVLMSSDILLHQTHCVPVGNDQRQHIELCRVLARRFNRTYGQAFVVPKHRIPRWGACIKALMHPHRKMSKSDNNRQNAIFLSEHPDSVNSKIKHAVTDSDSSDSIRYDPMHKPGVSNLLEIFHGLGDFSIPQLEKEFSGANYSFFKSQLSDCVMSFLRRVQKRHLELKRDSSYLKRILRDGADKARNRAHSTMSKVSKLLGLVEE